MNSILQDFLKNVKNSPNALAVKCENKELSYRQLDDLSSEIAIFLSDKIRKTDKIIPVYLPKSPIVIACMFACWKLRLAYSIIDKSTQFEIAKKIFNRLESSLIIDDEFISSFYNEKSINTNNKLSYNEKLVQKNTLNGLAAVSWTSGTTGMSKGVILSHRNFSHMPLTHQGIIEENTKFLNLASLSFAQGLISTFCPLSKGSSTHIIKKDKVTDIEYLSNYVKENNIENAILVPQLAQIFLKHADGLLKTMIIGGDINSNIFSDKTIVYNSYGQIEIGTAITFFKINKPYQRTPIGKPSKYISLYLLDENEKLIKEKNIVGEICVSKNIAIGYYKDEKLTKEKFISNPFSKSEDDKILLKTGDLAYYNENCDLVYYQRKDFMVNIHGYRVEPTEVEQALLKVDGISHAAVSGFDASKLTGIDNDIRLYAGYVSDKLIDEDRIRDTLKKILPDYMIPSVIKKIDHIPLNDRGKVDRKNIIPKNIEKLFKNIEKNIIKPNNQIEEKLIIIIKELLSIKDDDISIDTNLFSLGLHSLLTIELSNIILNEFNTSISPHNLLDNPSIKSIAEKTIQTKNNKEKYEEFSKHESKDYYPLSSQQLSYFYRIENNPINLNDNMPLCVSFDNSFGNIIKLKSVLLKTIGLNPYMKTSFEMYDNKIYQKRNDDYSVDIKIHEEKLTETKKKKFMRAFNLFECPLFRLELYYYDGKIMLLMDFHHIIADAYSIKIFFDDLTKIYNNENVMEKHSDYYIYSSDSLNIDEKLVNEFYQYFKEQIEKFPIELYLNSRKKIAKHEFAVMTENLENIEEIAKKYKVLLSDLYLLVIVLSLGEFLKTKNVLIEHVHNGRDKNQYLNAFGMFFRYIPSFFHINDNLTTEQYLTYIRENINKGIKYSNYIEKYSPLFYQLNPKIAYNYIPSFDKEKSMKIERLPHLRSHEKNEVYIEILSKKNKQELNIQYEKAYYNTEEIENLIKLIKTNLLNL
ncbi:MAG: AMP-binding protein [Methanobrevibacter sp.]|jgi:acyl-coenzyme A synthetase/AMP-(fatty) acid ligase/acyl carrier protein|nr:AMP-binding protein [Methanobrevibacter sp.]